MATPIPRNRATFTVTEVVSATQGQLLAGADATITGVVTDSRAVEKGNLFVALMGERFDGHRFLDQAAQGGAAALLVAQGQVPDRVPPGVAVLAVADTTRALGDLARFHRDRWGKTVVAVGGSAGKTSTKEYTAAALGADGTRVHKTTGNLNNQIGVPMTIFELTDAHDVAVLEMGTSQFGEMARLAEIGRPDVAIVTLVAPEHLDGIGSLARVAEEEAALLLALGPQGIAVVNTDAAIIVPWLEKLRANTVWRYGRGDHTDLQLLSFEVDEALRTHCAYRVRADGRAYSAKISQLGEGAALNAGAALSVALLLGRDPDRALAALEAVPATSGRMRIFHGKRDTLVIDDTYNANPRSMDLAIETAGAVARCRGSRAVAVLGTMKELGDASREHHLLVGERVAHEHVDVFVGCGAEMGPAVDLARTLGVPVAELAADAAVAAQRVSALVADRDVVLVKGSRSMAMEHVVSVLVGESAAEGHGTQGEGVNA